MKSHSTTADLLAGSEIFAELSAEERAAVERHSAYHHFDEGRTIFAEGDEAHSFFVIRSGEVLIRQQEDETRIRDVARFIAGESFGELDVLRASRRSATAVASASSEILVFPGPPERFADVLAREPEAFARVLQKLIAFLAGRIRSTNQLLSENSSWVRELRRQVYSDKLTGLFNTAFLKDSLKSFPGDSAETAAILMLKPDGFKQINDTYGHEVGDRTIRRLANAFNDGVSSVGSPIRYRGNELAALLPGFDPEAARRLGEELLARVSGMDISDMTGGEAVRLTASVGVASLPEDGAEGQEVFDRAYARLMEARSDGGNRIYGA